MLFSSTEQQSLQALFRARVFLESTELCKPCLGLGFWTQQPSLQAAASMAKPLLFLHIEQGPKSGHRLECKPSAIATIGRARANTLQISKDSGISQKHLNFRWTDGGDDEDSGWTIVDVGSSNGTIINDIQIEPEKVLAIKTGDLIKIGADTSIRVEILCAVDEVKAVRKAKGTSKSKGMPPGADNHIKGMPVSTENHGEGMRVTTGNNQHEAGLVTCKPLLAEGYHGKGMPEAARNYQHEADHGDFKPLPAAGGELGMTVEQWFEHMMEEGPKYLYQLSESIIQDVMLESKQFDDYVQSLS